MLLNKNDARIRHQQRHANVLSLLILFWQRRDLSACPKSRVKNNSLIHMLLKYYDSNGKYSVEAGFLTMALNYRMMTFAGY